MPFGLKKGLMGGGVLKRASLRAYRFSNWFRRFFGLQEIRLFSPAALATFLRSLLYEVG